MQLLELSNCIEIYKEDIQVLWDLLKDNISQCKKYNKEEVYKIPILRDILNKVNEIIKHNFNRIYIYWYKDENDYTHYNQFETQYNKDICFLSIGGARKCNIIYKENIENINLKHQTLYLIKGILTENIMYSIPKMKRKIVLGMIHLIFM